MGKTLREVQKNIRSHMKDEFKDIPIVVSAYNRADALKRLLGSLKKADLPDSVELVISVDGGGTQQVREMAEAFQWPFGKKRVIARQENLGVFQHILTCGDLSQEYGSVILLEDDLYVSPVFYHFATEAARFYQADEKIAGISLYSHAFNETALLPFQPSRDESDVFFLQIPSSWGQCWTGTQWEKFRDWYTEKGKGKDSVPELLPGNVAFWLEESWKKQYLKYMIERDRYFVYPRVSLTTNFGDAGTHHRGSKVFQVPLLYDKTTFSFKSVGESFAVYDAFCEILPERLARLVPELKSFDYATDLYGSKFLDSVESEYILTTKQCHRAEMQYGREMKPLEANVIEDIQGDEISFGRKEQCKNIGYREVIRKCSKRSELLYHYSMISHFHFTHSNEIFKGENQIFERYRRLVYRFGRLAIWLAKIEKAVPWPFRIVRNVLKAMGE